MRMLAVHTVPVWEEPDGTRTLGLGVNVDDAPHPVVGWANVMHIRMNDGRVTKFLAVYQKEDLEAEDV